MLYYDRLEILNDFFKQEALHFHFVDPRNYAADLVLQHEYLHAWKAHVPF